MNSLLLFSRDRDFFMRLVEITSAGEYGRVKVAWASDLDQALGMLVAAPPEACLIDAGEEAHRGSVLIGRAREAGVEVPWVHLVERPEEAPGKAPEAKSAQPGFDKNQLTAELLLQICLSARNGPSDRPESTGRHVAMDKPESAVIGEGGAPTPAADPWVSGPQQEAGAADASHRREGESRAEERFRIMADAVPLWMSGPDGQFDYCNRAWLLFTGRSTDGELDPDWTGALHADDRQFFLRTYGKAFAKRSPFDVEVRLRRHDGEWRWLVISAVPFHTGKGEFGGYIGSCSDISEQRQTEDQLTELTETLEQRVVRRTMALQRTNQALLAEIKERKNLEQVLVGEKAELQAAQEELTRAYAELQATQAKSLEQEKMASIGQLAAGMAHEINNPMAFISSNLVTLGKYAERLSRFIEAQSRELASRGPVPEEIGELRRRLQIDSLLRDLPELVAESHEGAERVTRLVRDLKSFSRVDEAEQKPADINQCLQSTLSVARNELRYKAEVVKEFGELPLTRCHPQQLNQVFLNLLVNAGQAIEKQGVIRVRTWASRGMIHICIADSGCGMPREMIGRVFEPFFTTKEVGEGTGLGLSIAYDIIKRHGGEIHIDSEPGKGTEFIVSLPIVT